ncbi:MAG: hypothetical protein N2323_00485 [candidate division WOR-3 bacterium]|nr:hypothetical protein [candidate division WOR-3 bacterium]MCX7836422.1 hypothetical protein [candidate division WOR-3 bacterium]MDW8113739.1 hypothetical protein [candidate division WOR-3 bacterium]
MAAIHIILELSVLILGIFVLKLAIQKAGVWTYPFRKYRQFSYLLFFLALIGFIFGNLIKNIKRMPGHKFLGISILIILLLSLIWEERNYRRRIPPAQSLQPYLTLFGLSLIIAQIFLAIFS